MNRTKIFFYILLLTFFYSKSLQANTDYFLEGKKLYNQKKFNESKYKFEKDIVFNPKNEKSYLYLAKIFKSEENEIEEEKNIYTTLLLEPDNEEAMYMLIDMKLEKSDIKKVEELRDKFKIICNSLCSKIDSIEERLSNINVNNES